MEELRMAELRMENGTALHQLTHAATAHCAVYHTYE